MAKAVGTKHVEARLVECLAKALTWMEIHKQCIRLNLAILSGARKKGGYTEK